MGALALIAIALVFLALFLFMPVAAVFVEALRDGLGAYFTAIADPEALSAIRLTLMTAAIAVPLNVAFGSPRRGRSPSSISRQANAHHAD